MPTETTNELSRAASPYLRSAMHQPIRWYEWGDKAFAVAQRENKPILLDVGAVWCHWCHVMDRESYESPEVAEIVNENFIAIKVDRDERPDIDSRYQAAVSAISGQGGWPLTAFLTADGRPFWGGTYFPPDDHWGRPGFKKVLQAIADAYRTKHDEVQKSAESVMSVLSAESFAGRSADFSPTIIEKIVDSAASNFDVKHGGFGQAPKFPHPAAMELVIDRYARTREGHLKTIVETTLMKMARGGVYDHIGGGFHRYSVDERWVVPHFEKMSYDNSELLKNYVHAYQALEEPFFAEVARDIVRWVDAWMSARERGGFYASQDADISLEDDGDYFTWTLDEARAVLNDEELSVAALYYDIGEAGEMHHDPKRNVLHARNGLEDVARVAGKSPEEASALLESAKTKMYAARLKRPTPYIDKTIYVNWNALMVSAYLAAGRVLDVEEALHFGLRSLDRILAEGWNPERGLKHVIAYSEPAADARDVAGMLDDYAFTVAACLDAYEATSDLSYFNFARRIGDAMVARFYDETGGGFFDVEKSEASGNGARGALSARRKPFQDAPTPAADPAAAIALLRLFAYTNEPSYREKAEDTLEVFAGTAERYGLYAGTYGIAAVLLSQPHTQVVVVGNDELAARLTRAALQSFALNQAVLRLPDNEAMPQNLPPALAETIPSLPAVQEGKTVAVVCSGFACQPPVYDSDELSRLLRQAVAGN